MTQHIGIVACSAEGAALCYRTVCLEGSVIMGPHDHPEVSMHTHSLAEYVRRIDRDDWVKQAKALAKGGEAEYIRVFGKKPR